MKLLTSVTLAISLKMATLAVAQIPTSKDASYYNLSPDKWDGKRITLMVQRCSSPDKSDRPGYTEFEVTTADYSSMIVLVKSDKAEAFYRRVGRDDYNQRRSVQGIFEAKGPVLVLE